MRLPITRTTLARISCMLACTTVLLGLIALFSNHWIENEAMHAGMVSGCYGDVCISAIDNIPQEYRTTYAVAVTMLFYVPLVLIIVSAILQGITVVKGPCKRRDVSGLVFAWLSGYHSLLLMVLLIAAASMIPSPPDTDTGSPSQLTSSWTTTTTTESPYNGGFMDSVPVYESQDYTGSVSNVTAEKLSFNVGWSAYFGLLAAILALASAVSSSLYFGQKDTDGNEDTIPLQSNVV